MSTHDVQLLLIDLAIILVLARLLGAAARRIGQPAVVGEIVAGILLGPTLFHGAITRALFPVDLKPVLSGVADVGLVLFMFIVGYELDASLIRGRGRQATSISLGSIVVPLAAGFGLGWWLAEHTMHRSSTAAFALFVGASMSVTAFPVLARILTDRGLHRTRLGGLAVASAAVDDITAWSLLAVVVTVAGVPGTEQWHVLFAPLYLLIMALVVRPGLRRVAARTAELGRLTPDVLAVVLAVLLLSSVATEWMGVHFIFGAFIAGAVMPREAAEALRQAILERLEQLSVLLLLPVFFVVSGSAVDLSAVDGSQVVQLLAILGVAIGGKFLGAYLGGRSAGVSHRQAGALATLMNTRGLTELIILNVGLQNGVIDPELFTLLVVMAVVTTAMTGPLLRLVYPERLINRDIADAARAALGDCGYRVLALLDPEPDPAVDSIRVQAAADLAAARGPQAQVVVVRLVPQRAAVHRLEVGTGLGADLMLMTRTLAALHDLGAAYSRAGVESTAYARFSDDVAADLATYVEGAGADLVVSGCTMALPDHEMVPRAVFPDAGPAHPATVSVDARDPSAVLEVAAQLCAARGLPLLVTGDHRRGRPREIVTVLTEAGLTVRAGEREQPTDTVRVGAEGTDAHWSVRPRRDEEVRAPALWAAALRVTDEANPVEPDEETTRVRT